MGKWTELLRCGPDTRHDIFRRASQIVFTSLLFGVLLFTTAGTLRWLYAWFYVGSCLLIPLIGFFVLPMDVIAERGRKKKNVESWDKTVTRLLIAFIMVVFAVAGLDRRWGWTPALSPILRLAGVTAYLLGTAIEIRAMSVNRFFSSAVRIQSDRGQTVCRSGPYRFIRHPGYLGMMLSYAFVPLLLGSLWALAPAFPVLVLFVVRTALEDRMLRLKLPGYLEYTRRTRYKLLPGVW